MQIQSATPTPNEPSLVAATTNTPLLALPQLVPGAILVGLTATQPWRVEEVVPCGRGPDVVLVNSLITRSSTHTHSFITSTRRCGCGAVRVAAASLLSTPDHPPRLYVLTPAVGVVLVVPDPRTQVYTLIQRATGPQLSARYMGGYSDFSSYTGPVIPMATLAWEVPLPLRRYLVDDAPAAADDSATGMTPRRL